MAFSKRFTSLSPLLREGIGRTLQVLETTSDLFFVLLLMLEVLQVDFMQNHLSEISYFCAITLAEFDEMQTVAKFRKS